MFRRLKSLFGCRTEQERMYSYLSQAQDQIHLEHLQREWDKMTHEQRRHW